MEMAERIMHLLAEKSDRYVSRFPVRVGSRIQVVLTDDIEWIAAAGDYAELHSRGRCHLLRETMNALEARLDPAQFLRIHRSTIVNIERIQEFQPLFHGDYAVLLRDGTQLTLSRTYRQRLAEVFGEAL